MSEKEQLILASQSPRRQELMKLLGVPFRCEPSAAEETVPEGISIEKTAEYLACKKAAEVLSRHPSEKVRVIGSDTIVVCDGKIFGKPENEEDAYQMLRALSGKTHQVYTGVAILSGKEAESFTSVVSVTFFPLTEEEIRTYIASGEPMDKAGAYGIQGRGALFIEKIEGDYYSVVGFPVSRVYRSLKNAGTVF